MRNHDELSAEATRADVAHLEAALLLHPDNPRLCLQVARLELTVAVLEGDEDAAKRARRIIDDQLAGEPADLDALAIAEEAAWVLGDVESALSNRARFDEEIERLISQAVVDRSLSPAETSVPPQPLEAPGPTLRRRPGRSPDESFRRRQALIGGGAAAVGVLLTQILRVLFG